MIKLKVAVVLSILAFFIGLAAYDTAVSAEGSIVFFSFNLSGQPPLFNSTTLDCQGNVTCSQDTINHKIILNVNATISGNNINNASLDPFNMNAANLTYGKVPYFALNVSLCNPANQFSVFNQNTFNFDCVSSVDDDSNYATLSQLALKVNSPVPDANGTSGQFLISAGNGTTAWTNVPPSGSTLSYYLHDDLTNNTDPTNSTYTPYSSKIMRRDVDFNEQTEFTNISNVPNGLTLIQNWTSRILNLSLIPAGVHDLHYHATLVGGGPQKVARFFYECGIVNATGNNISFRGSSPLGLPVTSALVIEDDLEMLMPDQAINSTDRMVIRVWVSISGTGTDPTVQLQYDDLTAARLIFPTTQQDITPLLNNVSILQSESINLMNTKLNKTGDIFAGKNISLVSNPNGSLNIDSIINLSQPLNITGITASTISNTYIVGGTTFQENGFQSNIWFVEFTTSADTNQTISELGINIVTANGGNGRLALYDNVSGNPKNLINETISTALNDGINIISIPSSSVLPSTNYWIAAQVDIFATVYFTNHAGSDYKAGAYGAFPATITAPTGSIYTPNMRALATTPSKTKYNLCYDVPTQKIYYSATCT